jgi:hypothetical protein
MPFPREETTPPVTNTYLVIYLARVRSCEGRPGLQGTASTGATVQDKRCNHGQPVYQPPAVPAWPGSPPKTPERSQ